MKNKWFIASIIILLLLIGIALTLSYFDYFSPPKEKVKKELTFKDSLNLLNLLHLSSPGINYYSAINVLDYQQIYQSTREKLSCYQDTIDEIAKDRLIRQHNISKLFITLLFLEDSVNHNHDLKSLVGWASKKKLRKMIPYKARKPLIKRNKKKIIQPHYLWVYSRNSVNKGKEFIKTHEDMLEKIEQKYKVNKEYLVAILFVESRFGKITGDHHVFSLYNSLYHLNKKRFVKEFYNDYIKERYSLPSIIKNNSNEISKYVSSPFTIMYLISGIHNLVPNTIINKPRQSKTNKTRKILRKKTNIPSLEKVTTSLSGYIDKKISMGYQQLVSLIIMTYKQKINIHQLKGSWAGAFGLGQFIPSSFLIWAQDGNNDGKIDLYDIADALASTAFYLRDAGFKANNVRKIIKSIYRYNQSSDYTRAIHHYAQALMSKKRVIAKYRSKRRRGKSAFSDVPERIEN